MLRLVGLGLSIDLLPIGSLLKLLKCDKVLIDTYTSIWFSEGVDFFSLLGAGGVEVSYASRRDLEGRAIDAIVEEARGRDVCIATPGDPLIATTHSAIVIEALKRGVQVEVSPSSSILNVGVSISCLQVYRFGRIATVVKPKNGIEYEYPLQIVRFNRSQDLHTLLLLEMDAESGYFMTPREAMEVLISMQTRWGEEVIGLNDTVVVLQAVASSRSRVYVRSVGEVISGGIEFREPPYTLIIPARRLHPIEKECLDNIEKMSYSYSQHIDIGKLLSRCIAELF
ncbi:MAG: diphthine synthase [Ignisphaera sp.]|nr:diphthine synthase [Ignisphaera sp.]MCX8168006.1 diphthine synthase [Ignisphaera sp.]MDW8085523.1 diphthine synthase [Ignisphaera sp.]